MKVRIKGNPITQFGSFSHGQVIDDLKYPTEFLLHLVNEAGAADLIDYETKIDNNVQVKKKVESSPSSQPAKASPKPTASRRKRKQK